MHTVFDLLCFVVVIHWLIFPYPSGLLHWHCGNLTIAPVPAKQPWWIWINTSCEFIMNDCITTTKQSTTKPCAYFLGYTVVTWCRQWRHYLSQYWLWYMSPYSTTKTHCIDGLRSSIRPFHKRNANSHAIFILHMSHRLKQMYLCDCAICTYIYRFGKLNCNDQNILESNDTKF